jgi:hypothetical protein
VKNLSDGQLSTCIGIVARIPVVEARQIFLERLTARLPAKGKVSTEQLTDAINATLKSFRPGQWMGDTQGVIYPPPDELSLNEAAVLYQRMIAPRGEWSWPPQPPPTPEEAKARAVKLAAMTQEELADRYLLGCLCGGDQEEFARRKAEEKRRKAETFVDTVPWPLPAPSSTQTIRGSVNRDEPEPEEDCTTGANLPTDADLLRGQAERPAAEASDKKLVMADRRVRAALRPAQDDDDFGVDENPPLRRRGGKQPVSHYGRALQYLQQRGLGKKPKAFF